MLHEIDLSLCFRLHCEVSKTKTIEYCFFEVKASKQREMKRAALVRISTICRDGAVRWHIYASGFIVGNNNTSLIDAESVRSITSLTIPKPRPPVGGIPYSSAVT